MPKIVDEVPTILKAYHFHGLDLRGSPNAVGECPFCGREEKFSVAVDTGKWRCLVCGESGNLTTFMRKVHEDSEDRVEDLAEARKVSPEALRAFGVCSHSITDEIAIPGYSTDRKLMTLYQWVEMRKGDRKFRVVQQTAGVGHQLFVPDDFDPAKKIVYVCEGPWDAMALWDALRSTKMSADGTLARTGSVDASLYAQANVVGIPGCGSVGAPFERWTSLLADKEVILCFDSDRPRKNGDRVVLPAGLSAARRASEILSRASQQPDTVSWVRWGNDGFDPDREDGFDVRDLLTSGDPLEGLAELMAMTEPIPGEWVQGRSATAKKNGKPEVEVVSCESWRDLENDWRKAMKWIPGLSKGLAASLASIVSTRAVGDQLWLQEMGPPSCGKTTLCEALAVAKRYVYSADTMTGLVSGYQVDREGSENQSMVLRLKDKTLVVKDADTILSHPSYQTIMSQFRGFYDRALRAQYGNKMSMAHEGINTTVILFGTNSLRKLDTSELGERFLRVVIMEGQPDSDLEREIMKRKFHQAFRDLSIESSGHPDSQVSPEMLVAKQRTGGYVTYLRQAARELLSQVECKMDAGELIMDYGLFVAYMRARPSSRQDESNEREFGTRLVSQITRLAGCLTVVLNRREIDDEVMRLTRSITMDTANGRTLEICRALAVTGREGLSMGGLTTEIAALTDVKVKELVKFLRQIGAVESYVRVARSGVRETKRYRLTERVAELYGRVVTDG